MHTHHQQSTDMPRFSCEPNPNKHAKDFRETAVAFKTTLQAAFRLIKDLVVLTWAFIKLAALRFWEIKGRCWWSVARDFSKQGLSAVKKDAFNG
ncbi:hypothetical protein [Desulfoplanes formicivorans]|uniref:Uncharacterized protein n=1 Tax=Desulfoplanes formicivorans TaxID=1592317 RepID=A0A194AJR8_9BACT|nr:hypothetical protein [Desulfoplanes formicivorans]GAU08974.1 hypothetical protein DPF_1693 [Desulfoplanes formicivorans]